MIWEYIGKERTNIRGRWYFPGQTATGENPPSSDFKKKGTKTKQIPESDSEPETEGRDLVKEMLKLKMKTLREFGAKYDCRDTSKSELVMEIVAGAPIEDIQEFVNKEGDAQ